MNTRKYKKTSVSRCRMMPFKMMHHEKDLMMLTIQETTLDSRSNTQCDWCCSRNVCHGTAGDISGHIYLWRKINCSLQQHLLNNLSDWAFRKFKKKSNCIGVLGTLLKEHNSNTFRLSIRKGSALAEVSPSSDCWLLSFNTGAQQSSCPIIMFVSYLVSSNRSITEGKCHQ